jgi:hypothetical protein
MVGRQLASEAGHLISFPNNSAIQAVDGCAMSPRTSLALLLLSSVMALGAAFFIAIPNIIVSAGGMFSQQSSPTKLSDAQIELLASDAHVLVGGVSLVAPFAALPDYTVTGASFSLDKQRDDEIARERLTVFRKATSDSRTPAWVDMLKISVRVYGANDSGQGIDRVCPRLTRRWSKSICEDSRAPILQTVPHRFYLIDQTNSDAFRGHSTIGGERISDQLRSMHLQTGSASIVCDKTVPSRTRFCTAAILIEGRLAAVWSVWDGEVETSSQRADREGKAVTAFVLHALRPAENFPVLFETACRFRAPASRVGPEGDLCSGRVPSKG